MKIAINIYLILVPIVYILVRAHFRKQGTWTLAYLAISLLFGLLNPLFILCVIGDKIISSKIWDKKLPDWM